MMVMVVIPEERWRMDSGGYTARTQRPVKNVGQSSPPRGPSLFLLSFFSFFSTANSPHASRGSRAPVYKGARVLEMMASTAKKKGRSATCISEGYIRI